MHWETWGRENWHEDGQSYSYCSVNGPLHNYRGRLHSRESFCLNKQCRLYKGACILFNLRLHLPTLAIIFYMKSSSDRNVRQKNKKPRAPFLGFKMRVHPTDNHITQGSRELKAIKGATFPVLSLSSNFWHVLSLSKQRCCFHPLTLVRETGQWALNSYISGRGQLDPTGSPLWYQPPHGSGNSCWLTQECNTTNPFQKSIPLVHLILITASNPIFLVRYRLRSFCNFSACEGLWAEWKDG